jgi:hypothetical protein
MASSTQPTINTYVSDLLALEKHIVEPLKHQASDDLVAKIPVAARAINAAHAAATARVDALTARLEALGGHAGEPIKSAVASTLGTVAAAIGDARKTEVSKYLRDDYSALALASASYTMLHTTALALGDTATAALAQNGLTDVATNVMQISKTLPAVVLAELQAEGLTIDASVLNESERDVKEAWQSGGARAQN